MVIDTTTKTRLALAIGRRKEATAIVHIYNLEPTENSEILINNYLAEVFLQFNAAYLNSLYLGLSLLNLEKNYLTMLGKKKKPLLLTKGLCTMTIKKLR